MAKQEEPVTVEQTLTVEDCAEAAAAVEYFAHPMRRNSVRGAMCLTAAAISASLIYACAALPKYILLPECAAGIFLLLGGVFLFGRPQPEKRRAKKWFRACPLAALPQKAAVFHDRVELSGECEQMTEYFTDFSICVETNGFIAAVGGRERNLLVVKKTGQPPETAEKLSTVFRHAFDGRWYRMPHGKGGA